MFGPGIITLIISNQEMNDIMKVVQSLEESGLLIIGGSKTIKNNSKEHKGGFIGRLLDTLGASLLDMLAGKGVLRAGKGTIRASGTIRACQEF